MQTSVGKPLAGPGLHFQIPPARCNIVRVSLSALSANAEVLPEGRVRAVTTGVVEGYRKLSAVPVQWSTASRLLCTHKRARAGRPKKLVAHRFG